MLTAQQPASGLLGREKECDRLDRLVANVRTGHSRVLVLRGEAGVGKTALLEHLAARATDCTLVRAGGVESEMELAFAGLHALCVPLLDHLPRLPEPQRIALGTAFGLAAGPPPDRFIVGLAVLSLFAEAAEHHPLLCIVDDAQWLDRVSTQTLTFVGRRLLAERVGLVLGVRTAATDDWADLPTFDVAGLASTPARALLDRAIPGPLDERVRERILAEAGGNPLGLLELPRGLGPTGIAGGYGLPEPASLTSRLEQSFIRQLDPLSAPARRLLLLAAAEPLGDVGRLRRSASELGIGPVEMAEVEDAGLIDIGTRVRFRHPLVRSATYRAADPADRRAVHAALATATDPELDPDRRAWHRAQAAAHPDESVAEDLERSAGRAQSRGGIAAAAAFLQRSAALTPDPRRRGARALAGAQAKFEAGDFEAASQLLSLAEASSLDELHRARLARLRAQVSFAARRGSDAPPLLLAAARQLEALDPGAAREAYVEALDAALAAGRLHSDRGVRDAAQASRAAPAAPPPPRSLDLILDGLATRFTDGPAAAAPTLRSAVAAFSAERPDDHTHIMRWLALSPLVQQLALFELWDADAYHSLATRSVQLARQAGALSVLPYGLWSLAAMEMFAGDFAASAALLQEADAIRAAIGTSRLVLGGLGLGAWRGDEAEATRLIRAAQENALARGEGRVVSMAGCCTAILCNGLARYDSAVDGATRGSEDDDQGYVGWSLVELVEAASRTGRHETARDALRRLEVRTHAAGTDWALGVLARSRALTSQDAVADTHYQEAIERLARTRLVLEALRARLVYGEWLRREQRRREAREQLRTAYDELSEIGAVAYAERARRELVLTGESVPRRTPETRDVLTPQEAQIARMARDGQSNPEIGAQLFISPRTVEYHLRKVFTKLGISGRKELKGALGT